MSKKNKTKEYQLFKIDEKTAQKLGLATGLFPEQLEGSFCLVTEKGKLYEENDLAVLYKPTSSGKKKTIEVNNIAEAYAFFKERASQMNLEANIVVKEPKVEKKYQNPIEKVKYNKVSDALMYTTDMQQILSENDSFMDELEKLDDIYKQARKNLKDAMKNYEIAQSKMLELFLDNLPPEASLESLSYDERDDYFSDEINEDELDDDYDDEDYDVDEI